jgi:hypothetical protein
MWENEQFKFKKTNGLSENSNHMEIVAIDKTNTSKSSPELKLFADEMRHKYTNFIEL